MLITLKGKFKLNICVCVHIIYIYICEGVLDKRVVTVVTEGIGDLKEGLVEVGHFITSIMLTILLREIYCFYPTS